MFDVTVCQFGAPIVLSWPHFLGAEEKFRDAVEGLEPDRVRLKKKKDIFIFFFFSSLNTDSGSTSKT